MPICHSHITEDLIKKKLDRGDGQCTGGNYHPWIRVGDFGSQGRVHRILRTDGRIHHYMSDLERDYYYHLLWQDSNFIDLKEQYPLLPLERTQELADNCGFAYPCDPETKCPIVMTSDFVITVREKDGDRTIARAV